MRSGAWIVWSGLVLAVALLTGCGGGGSGDVELSVSCGPIETDPDGTITVLRGMVSMDPDGDYENVVFRFDLVTEDGEIVDQHESSFTDVDGSYTYSQEIDLDASAIPDGVSFAELTCSAVTTGVNVEEPPYDDGFSSASPTPAG